MKRHILISMAAATLLSLGLVTINSTNANAAVRVGQRNRLARNSYIYNSLGRRVRRSSLKKGRLVYVAGKKTIKGKAYVRIGRNQYIRLVNFSKPKASSRQTGVLTHNAFIYNRYGHRISKKSLKMNKIVSLLGVKTIKGKRYYQIGKNSFVKAANVSKTISNDINQSTNSSESSVKNNSNSSSNTNNGTNSVTNNNSNIKQSENTNSDNKSTKSTDNNKSSNKPSTPVKLPTQPSKSNSNPQSQFEFSNDGQFIIRHNSYVYNDKGVRQLGKFVSKGDKVELWGPTLINNKDYYYIQVFNSDYQFIVFDGYIPIDALASDGKDQKFNPATSKDFEDFMAFLRNMNGKVYNHVCYELASPAAKSNYQKVSEMASLVANDVRSSKQDILTAENMMTKAFDNLDGKKVEINANKKGHKFTKSEIKEIMAVINKKRGTTDAKYIGYDGKYINYVSEHRNCRSYVGDLVHFKDEKI